MNERELSVRMQSLKNSGADERHLRKKLKELRKCEPWAKAYDVAAGIVEKGGILVFLGDRGNGKTQMGVELIRKVCREAEVKAWHIDNMVIPSLAVYARIKEIGMKLREAFDKDAKLTELKALKLFTEPDILVIDECQERAAKEFEVRNLTMILDKRYGAVKPTILIANMEKDAFASLMGSSVTDRIKEAGGVITFDWESFR